MTTKSHSDETVMWCFTEEGLTALLKEVVYGAFKLGVHGGDADAFTAGLKDSILANEATSDEKAHWVVSTVLRGAGK